MSGCPAPPQGGGKPCPYYIRASQADPAWRRDGPGGRPDLLTLAPMGMPDSFIPVRGQDTKRAAATAVLFVSWLLSLPVDLFPRLLGIAFLAESKWLCARTWRGEMAAFPLERVATNSWLECYCGSAWSCGLT